MKKNKDRMKKFRDRMKKNQEKFDLYFIRNKLCSVKQFVGEGELYIDDASNIFSSKSVEVVINRTDGNSYRLYCDTYISNGIKIGDIDEDFLLFEELRVVDSSSKRPIYITNCCVFYENGELVIKFDKGCVEGGWWDFYPFEGPNDDRFNNRNFKILCRVIDYIGDEGSFYQNKNDKREFVITRFEGDPSAVRILCSQDLEFQLLNGKNPKDLLENYISIFVNRNGDEYLRIFDTKSIKPQKWYKHTGILFIIQQVMRNPYQYSFYNLSFDKKKYLKIK